MHENRTIRAEQLKLLIRINQIIEGAVRASSEGAMLMHKTRMSNTCCANTDRHKEGWSANRAGGTQ